MILIRIGFGFMALVVGSNISLAATTNSLSHTEKGVNLQIGASGDQMIFDKNKLAAPVGASIKLTFNNESTLQHNFVLTQIGKLDEVVNAGMSAGPSKSFVLDGPNVIAHTQIVGPGQSETISFVAPTKPGSYPYVCTFPGHSGTMRGILKIK